MFGRRTPVQAIAIAQPDVAAQILQIFLPDAASRTLGHLRPDTPPPPCCRRTFTAERAAHASSVAEAAGRHVGRRAGLIRSDQVRVIASSRLVSGCVTAAPRRGIRGCVE
jgi:hypothetical protein